MKKDYLSVVYDENRTPKTGYPLKLVEYLVRKFDLKNGERLLEIGCGRGDFLNAFRKVGLNSFGVDAEKKTQELLPDFDIRQCDISKDRLPFEDNTFDVVYHKSLIEHLYDPVHLMDETRRVLKEGAKLIIFTPDWQSQMENFYEDFTHRRPYTIQTIKDLLDAWGFKDITSEKFYQLPSVWRYPSLSIFSKVLSKFLSVDSARWVTEKTGSKFFRFSVELMILGSGKK